MKSPNDRQYEMPEGDDSFDELIRRAHRQVPDEAAVTRLADSWQQIAAEQRTRNWYPYALAAAIAIVAGSVGVWHFWRAPVDQPRVVEQSQPHDVQGKPASQDRDAPDAPPEQPTVDPYRQVLQVAAHRMVSTDQPTTARQLRRRVVELLSGRQEIDEATIASLMASLQVSHDDLESEVARLTLSQRGRRQVRAIELLSQLATDKSLDTLLQLWQRQVAPQQVAATLAQVAPPTVLAGCYVQSPNAQVRGVLARALVARVDAQDVPWLLELVATPQRSAELLGAIGENRHFPAAQVMPLLDSSDRQVRFAAARVLGAVRDPRITQRLIGHVRRNHRRPEALAALAASRDPLAQQFIAQVQRDRVLAAALQSALVQAELTNSWYGG